MHHDYEQTLDQPLFNNEIPVPLFQQIFAFIEGSELFHSLNDSFCDQLKQDLLSIANMDWETHHGAQKKELMEIYYTGDSELDQEFEMELEEIILEMKQTCQDEILQRLFLEICKPN